MPDKKAEKPEEPKKKVAAKLFDDVKRPEDTLAISTSKPVIVGHTNIIKDPMVSLANTPATEIEETEKIVDKPKHEITIEPLTSEKTDEKPAEDEVTITEEAGKDTKTEEATSTEETDDSVNEDFESTESAESATGAVDAIAGTINTKKERSEQDEKQQVIDNEINELINSKQYNVKIRSTPNKRKARLLIILIVLAILGGAFWYLGIGPGKDLWLKESNTNKVVGSANTEPTTQNTEKTTTPSLTAFTNSTIKTTFSYPNTWKIEVAKDSTNPKFDVITLTSPNEEIDSVTSNSPPAKTGVFMRTKIILENTENNTQFTSKLTQLTSCVSEDLIVGSTNLKLLLSDTKNQSPNISKLSLSPNVCIAEANLFSANDQVQLSTKQNIYVINSEFILTMTYLEKNGIKEATAVAQAQESGITTTPDAFKASNSYKQLVEVLKTLKEL